MFLWVLISSYRDENNMPLFLETLFTLLTARIPKGAYYGALGYKFQRPRNDDILVKCVIFSLKWRINGHLKGVII